MLAKTHGYDLETRYRESLPAFDNDAKQLLADYKHLIVNNVNLIIEEIYRKQALVNNISVLINDEETLQHLCNSQQKFIMYLFSGRHDSEHINSRLEIGKFYKQIGLEPYHYFSSMSILREKIYNIFISNLENNELLAKVINALDKLLFYDAAIVLDGYVGCLKEEIESTDNKIKRYVERMEEKIIQRTKELEKLANIDALTNCYNRRAMENLLKREVAVARRRQTTLSFVYFDIDDFKLVNDELGHLKGDEVLKYIGQSMIDLIREVDIPCRYGGDEFCMILPECKANNAKIICRKLLMLLNSKYPEITLSFGIIENGPKKYLDSKQLIKAADDKMYMAKRERGSHIQF